VFFKFCDLTSQENKPYLTIFVFNARFNTPEMTSHIALVSIFVTDVPGIAGITDFISVCVCVCVCVCVQSTKRVAKPQFFNKQHANNQY
jgi:hypothetical protein